MARESHAQGLLTDQSLQPPPYISGESYHYDAALATLLSGTGQEFTPTLQGLDFVDVSLSNPAAAAGTFEIAIHQGTIVGPVLGLSDPVVWSDTVSQSGDQFVFSSTVPLVAGDLYVLEIIQLAGDQGWTIEIPGSAVVNGKTIDMNYPGGRLIYGGVPQDNLDMIFREGVFAVPEPNVNLLYLLGVLAIVFGIERFVNKSA